MHIFSPTTKVKSQEVNENFQGLADGSEDTDNNSLALYRAESQDDFVASGCIWTLVSGLNGTMTAGVVYVHDVNGDMIRLPLSLITSKAFTASKDTYVDVGYDGVIDYNEVANNATSPTLASNHIRLAKIVTNGSTITSVDQFGVDSQNNFLYPTANGVRVSGGVTFNYYHRVDVGNTRKYFRYITGPTLNSIAANATAFWASGFAYPPGLIEGECIEQITLTVQSNAGSIVLNREGGAGATTLAWVYGNIRASVVNFGTTRAYLEITCFKGVTAL